MNSLLLHLLLHLLLALLQFLEELFGRLDVWLSFRLLLLLIVNGLLVVRLVSLVSLVRLILGLSVVSRISRIIRAVVCGVLPFDNRGIGPWRSCHWHRYRPIVWALVVGTCLLTLRLRIALGRAG